MPRLTFCCAKSCSEQMMLRMRSARRLLERVHDVAVGVQRGPVRPEHIQRRVFLLVPTLAGLQTLVANEPVHVKVRALGHALIVALRLRHVVVAVLHDLQHLVVAALPAELGLEVERSCCTPYVESVCCTPVRQSTTILRKIFTAHASWRSYARLSLPASTLMFSTSGCPPASPPSSSRTSP